MAETVGTITSIKVGSFLPGSVNSFDICVLNVTEQGTASSWMFYLWISRDVDPLLQRILQTQRLALAREAAIQQKIVHIVHDDNSGIVDSLQVDFA